MNIEEKENSLLVKNIHSRVRSSFEEFGLVNAKLVVAVSGGSDSQTLLHVLNSIKDDLSLTLHGAHFNHGLRIPESDHDAKIVETLFKEYNMKYSIESAFLKNLYQGTTSTLETTARKFRYDFFYKIAAQEKADAIILGHTYDDQAETVMMNIFRGTGLQGLQGMQIYTTRRRFKHSFAVFRPLISTSHKENLSYCKISNILPIEDPTNFSLIPRRNWIRNSILQSIKKFYPNVIHSLNRLATISQEDANLIEELVDTYWETALSQNILPSLNSHESISLKITELVNLNVSIKKRLLRKAYFNIAGSLENLTYHHIEQIVNVLNGESGKACSLPNAIQVINEYNTLTFYKAHNGICDSKKFIPIKLKVPGETILSKEWSIVTSYSSGSSQQTQKQESLSASFRASLGETNLKIRIRNSGDRFQPLGMAKEKILSRYFIDQKIPRNRRCCLPLLTSNNSIAWVGGKQIAEWSKVSQKDQPILLVRLKNNRLQNQT